MGLMRKQRVGEGMHYIPLQKGELDLTVKLLEIGGSKRNRNVTIGLSGMLDSEQTAEISPEDGNVRLVFGYDLFVRVERNTEHVFRGSACMNYSAPRNSYKLERIEFRDAEEPDHKYP